MVPEPHAVPSYWPGKVLSPLVPLAISSILWSGARTCTHTHSHSPLARSLSLLLILHLDFSLVSLCSLCFLTWTLRMILGSEK